MRATTVQTRGGRRLFVQRAERGDAAAHGDMFAALQAELHRLALREAARYRPNGRLGATTLLHGACRHGLAETH